MYRATKTFTFDSAHMLSDHVGKCRNLHGHTYTLEVTVSKSRLTFTDLPASMVLDFSIVSEVVRKTVLDRFDHAFVYDMRSDVEREIATILEAGGRKTVSLPNRSTVEYLAQLVYELLESPLRDVGVHLESVRLWETPTSYAEYQEG